MKAETNNKVTIDDLAVMVANGFQEQSSQIKASEERIEKRIDGMEQKLGALHSEVLSMNFDHRKLKVRMENVEIRVFGSIQEA